jgi:RNA polymerase sigma-70 factor, ECF subfamily
MADTFIENNLAAAQAGNHEAFARLTDPFRSELLAHCYRMLGSMQDAEDLVQETFLRAWHRLDTFEYYVSFRAWLYKIATNACIDVLDKRRPRTLPASAYPASDPRVPFEAPLSESTWIEPYFDELFSINATDPEARYILHESITLAFMVALQTLPPRQRAIMIMRDVLGFSTNDVAGMLELTISAVNSMLHRARVTLSKRYPVYKSDSVVTGSASDPVKAVLNQFVLAWELGDVGKLVGLLKEDAALTMPPSPSWYHGREAIRTFLESFPLSGQGREQWQLQPTQANTQPAFKLYLHDPLTGLDQAVGLQVLTLHAAEKVEITEITVFLTPEFLSRFGF